MSNNEVIQCIALRLKEKHYKKSFKVYNRIAISNVTAKSGPILYALGWFQLTFWGEVCVKNNKITLKGYLKLLDRYDWANPGEKYVPLTGDKIYDKWAHMVERAGKALPYDVRSRGITSITKEFNIDKVDETACLPGNDGKNERDKNKR